MPELEGSTAPRVGVSPEARSLKLAFSEATWTTRMPRMMPILGYRAITLGTLEVQVDALRSQDPGREKRSNHKAQQDEVRENQL